MLLLRLFNKQKCFHGFPCVANSCLFLYPESFKLVLAIKSVKNEENQWGAKRIPSFTIKERNTFANIRKGLDSVFLVKQQYNRRTSMGRVALGRSSGVAAGVLRGSLGSFWGPHGFVLAIKSVKNEENQ